MLRIILLSAFDPAWHSIWHCTCSTIYDTPFFAFLLPSPLDILFLTTTSFSISLYYHHPSPLFTTGWQSTREAQARRARLLGTFETGSRNNGNEGNGKRTHHGNSEPLVWDLGVYPFFGQSGGCICRRAGCFFSGPVSGGVGNCVDDESDGLSACLMMGGLRRVEIERTCVSCAGSIALRCATAYTPC